VVDRGRLPIVALLVALACAALLPGVLSVWVDPSGHPTLTDREEPPAPGAVRLAPDQLLLRWKGSVLGAPLEARAQSSSEDDRYLRELDTAADDLARGEMRLGLDRLRRLQRGNPARPEAAWLVAQTERRRGRLEPARTALQDVLSTAPRADDPWREAAAAMLREVEAELALASAGGTPRFEAHDTSEFRIRYDHAFAGRDYGARVEALLHDARALVQDSLGRALDEPLDVHLYTKGRYLESYKHKFGFATVGFYDGAIHVVSARHPRDELLALLVHEYAHAVFRQAFGSDEPFFLNEGIAEREEERARGRERLAREEWRQLLDAQRAGTWIPLRSIVRGFSGLEGRRALLAYLESRAAGELIEARHPGALGRWLARAAAGTAWERALERETGWDLARLEAELGRQVRDRFLEEPTALSSPAKE
jgi:hypothetical protein